MDTQVTYQGNKVDWKGNGVYSLARPSRESNWEYFWFKIEKMNHVETALELGMTLIFLHECDLTKEEV